MQQEYSSVSDKCGFWISNQVRYYFNEFTPEQQIVLKKLLARPEAEKSIVSPSGLFRIHFNETIDKPSYIPSLSADQNAFIVGQIADSVYYFEIQQLGYTSPPSDTLGGDNKYDIYISNLVYYGETEPESYISSNSATSYMRIDNDLNYYTKGIHALRVTIAHEFFHAIQLGNYKIFSVEEERFIFEISSTAMEEFLYDYVNDYYQYLNPAKPGSYFYEPTRHLTAFGEGYGLCVLPIYLKEKFGYNVIKSIWEHYRSKSAIEAISSAVSVFGSTLGHELNVFGIWTYFTGYRKQFADPKIGAFEEGENYPLITPTYMEYTAASFPLTMQIPCMSNLFQGILIQNGVYKDTVVSLVTNSNISGAIQKSYDNFQLSIFDNPAQGSKLIANNYYSKLQAEQSDWFNDAYFFNSRMMSGGEFIINEVDYAYPNPFTYENHSAILIPADYNESNYAQLNIYSTSLDLIYTGLLRISYPHNKFVLEWNGLDNNDEKLSSGVYLYVVNSGDKIRKGKLVIFSRH